MQRALIVAGLSLGARAVCKRKGIDAIALASPQADSLVVVSQRQLPLAQAFVCQAALDERIWILSVRADAIACFSGGLHESNGLIEVRLGRCKIGHVGADAAARNQQRGELLYAAFETAPLVNR